MLAFLAGLVVGFVVGALVGRRNKQKLDVAVAKVETVVDKTGVKL